MKVYDVLYFIISRTRRKYRRRRRSTDGVLQVRRGIHDEVYDALHFTNRRTRRRYQRRRERADGVLLFSMKYMMSYTRSERVWINCAATLTAISAGVSLPMSIPMGVITRATCCSL